MIKSRVSSTVAAALAVCSGAFGQLNQNCTVSVLNRNVLVSPDGSWVLPNVPANMGPVKARATCVQNGVTTSGESAFFAIPANSAVNLPDIVLGSATQIPTSLSIAPSSPTLTARGQTVQLTVTALYPDSSTRNVTGGALGTSYTTSNTAIATVSADGLVTAVSSGVVIIQAIHDGAVGFLSVRVTLASADTDGDGIADDVEIANGLNPNNPVDALEDFDRDGLNNRDELALGTNIRNPDTDGDGLLDGDEVTRGTNPLLADTDGDLIPDGVEVQTGTNPLDRTSYDLRRAAASFSLTPANFVLTTSVLFPQASQQLRFQVSLIDGKTTLDLTAGTTGTTYTSSNLNVCNFGAQAGQVFAGQPGSCGITAVNNTLSLTATGTVRSFTPGPLSFVSIPGTAMNVDVSGRYAYVAAGAEGLVVVDVGDKSLPRVVATLPLAGFANDVKVSGNYAYVASGASGLRIINVSSPTAPVQVGLYDTPGDAQDVVVSGTRAFVADGAQGLQVIDVTDPAAPALLGSRSVGSVAVGVDYDPIRRIAVLALGSSGLSVIDLANPANPVSIGSLAGGNVRDVALSGNFAFLADRSRSFTSVDLTNPAAPVLRASTPSSTGGLLEDVAVMGTLAFGADIFFVNDVPIIDVANPASPIPRLLLPFRGFRDDDGTGIAVDNSYVYLTANAGNGRLYIGQYTIPEDRLGIPPITSIVEPRTGETVILRSNVSVQATATDDVGVASVSFFANGQPIGTDWSAPYSVTFTPTALGTTTISAVASDFGGNSTSAQVTLTVIADPLTTVTGRVVDSAGSPVDSARARVFGTFISTTGLDGRFWIPNVPTILGDVAVYGLKGTLSGRSRVLAPVRGGTTDVGDIRILDPPTRLFPVEVSYTPAGPAVSMATGDLNADGYIDAVVAHYSPFVDDVSVLLGRGDGSFQDSRTHRMGGGGGYPRGVTLADLNRDGSLDIVTANLEGVGVSVALGNGDGTFRSGRGFSAGSSPQSVAAADLNGDGYADIVVANATSNDVSVLINNGDASFQPRLNFAAGGRPRYVAIADLNGDARRDIVIANSESNSVSVLHGNGDGSFQPQSTFPVDAFPVALDVADVNGDGRLDVITSSDTTPSRLSILIGNGDGTFQRLPGLEVGSRPLGVKVADVNGDGWGDIFTANYGSNDASILLNNGNGTFGLHREFGAGNGPQSLAVTDLDDDGRLDLLLGNGASWNVSIVLGNGDGTFPAAGKYGIDSAPASVAVGDLNSDGRPDVVTGHAQGFSTSTTVSVLLGAGAGTFSPRTIYVAGNQLFELAITDVNRDGRRDVVAASYWNHQLVVLLGNGDGTLQPQRTFPSSGSPTSMALADFNRDGSIDVVMGVGNSPSGLSVLLGNGDGTFQAALKPTINTQCSRVTAGDLNGDDRPDIVCTNADGSFSIFLGNGNATFQVERQFSAGMRPWAVALGDVNGDGRQDVVLGPYFSGSVAINLGNGDGTFQPPTFVPVGPGRGALALSDLDGDDRLDIAVAPSDSHSVFVLLGNGNGTFRLSGTYFTGVGPNAIAISDLDGDGHLDIVNVNGGTQDISVLLNQRQ